MVVVSRQKELSEVPTIGSVVTCQVIRINPRVATVRIVCSGGHVLREGYSGIIRYVLRSPCIIFFLLSSSPYVISVQDVRATEVDSKTEIYKCFRPGDVVTAEVLSLGDARSYYLTTASNDYGVIYAKSVAGATMVPISWESMLCPKTKTKEYRKVARPASLGAKASQ